MLKYHWIRMLTCYGWPIKLYQNTCILILLAVVLYLIIMPSIIFYIVSSTQVLFIINVVIPWEVWIDMYELMKFVNNTLLEFKC